MNDAPSRPNVGLIAAAILIALLAAYLIGYFAAGRNGVATIGPRSVRLHIYQHRWQADLFRPLARVESVLVGQEVDTAFRN